MFCLLKRVVPFALALGLGLFIASFFVSVTPNLSFPRVGGHKHREIQRLKLENRELRRENSRLRMELEHRSNMPDVRVPVVDSFSETEAPIAPPAPRTPRFK